MSTDRAKRNKVENLNDWSNRLETVLWSMIGVLVLIAVAATAAEFLRLTSKLG